MFFGPPLPFVQYRLYVIITINQFNVQGLFSFPQSTSSSMSLHNMASYLAQVPAILLSLEHFLGGQARITSILTPSLYKRAVVDKGPGTAAALYPIIPLKDPVRHSNVIGMMMVTEGCLLAWPSTRGSVGTLALNTFLTGAGIYSQRRMRIPYWLPCVNMALGLIVWWIENRDGL